MTVKPSAVTGPWLEKPNLCVACIDGRTILTITKALLERSIGSELTGGLGYAAPEDHQHLSHHESGYCAWVSPHQWLVVANNDDTNLAKRLAASLSDRNVGILNCTDALKCVRIENSDAVELLMKGSRADFRVKHFPVNTSIKTLFAGQPVTIMRTGVDVFELFYDHSFEHMMGEWIRQTS